jgi:uroporphyrinogen decarboxylase
MDLLGIEREATRPQVALGVSFKMIPTFEEKVLEHQDGHYIVQDWMGAITEISDEYDYTYIRSAKDFVTRKWHRFPVQSREDWEERMRWRYDPYHVERFPPDFEERCAALRERDYPLSISVNGPFWQMREWVGMENLCMLMIDDPDFVLDMAHTWTEFVSATIRQITDRVELDAVRLSEDMAYKAHSMISPAMVRQFLMPAYLRWVSEIQASGCPIVDMDSDGNIEVLIPLWIESGINVCDPIEVAAGNDIVAYRERFGRRMAYRGGIDKRAIAAGGQVMRDEVLRVVPPLLEEGGYIPSCDHGVPPDISWPNFVEYTRLLAELTGWL